MNTESTKTCRVCDEEKSLSEMASFTKNGKTYRRSECKKCRSAQRKRWEKRNPKKYKDGQSRLMAKRALQRSNLEKQDQFIFWDSRSCDRKAGRKNDLTREFIRETIARGCHYCGESSIRMTLDRVDNTKGHTKENVVPACIRCNYLRKDMPYEAWLVVVVGVREARDRGLFGKWTGRVK